MTAIIARIDGLDKIVGTWYSWCMQSDLDHLNVQIQDLQSQVEALTKSLEAVGKVYAEAAAELVAMKQARLIEVEQEPEIVDIADLDTTGTRFSVLEPE